MVKNLGGIMEPTTKTDNSNQNTGEIEESREVFTSVIDYSLDAIVNLVKRGKINLDPSFQRRLRWKPDAKHKLIESFLMNIPVPPIYLNEDKFGRFSVIDGKQRLIAITEFLSDELRLEGLEYFPEANGKLYSELSDDLQTVMSTKPTLRAVIVLRHSIPEVKYEVFYRLNTGGIKLNAQEIRNSAFSGNLNDLIVKLSQTDEFYDLLGIKNKPDSRYFKEMKDAELVTRYFAFRDDWELFTGGVANSLNYYMENNQEVEAGVLSEMEEDFLLTVSKVNSVFGEYSFRRWDPSKERWRSGVIASLFEAQMIACRYFALADLAKHREDIIDSMKDLFSDEDFLKYINASIPSYFILRIRKIIETITGILNAATN